MQISKSTRHSKITGDFGEAVVLYWLSKYGFECARVDHTGIDIIARNPHSDEVIGISVKSRSRNMGKEEEYVSIPNDQIAKAKAACSAFNCVPYLAVVVDAGDRIRAWILPLAHLEKIFPMGRTACGWKMTTRHLRQYGDDPNIMSFEFASKTGRWWQGGEWNERSGCEESPSARARTGYSRDVEKP